MYERRMSEDNLTRFEDERRVWQEEKEKVKTEERFHPFPSNRWFTLALLPAVTPPPPPAPPSIQVIRYQKQLQQNYILMYRRNRDLERVMRELSVELESRDADDYEVRSGSNDIHFEEITATEIWGRTELTITNPCTKKNPWKLRTRREKKKKEQRAGPNTALPWRWFDLNHGATRTACHCQKRENSQKGAFLLFC